MKNINVSISVVLMKKRKKAKKQTIRKELDTNEIIDQELRKTETQIAYQKP